MRQWMLRLKAAKRVVKFSKQCNRKFDKNRIGPHAVGGCNPSYLPSRQAGGNVIISVADLKAGARYF